MDLNEYRNRNRKAVTLPSGLELTIKKLSVREVAQAQTNYAENDEMGKTIAIVTGCVVGPFQLVDKGVSEVGENELSVAELDNADFECLVNSINEFSGLNTEDTDPK
jgi:hypothetical protein